MRILFVGTLKPTHSKLSGTLRTWCAAATVCIHDIFAKSWFHVFRRNASLLAWVSEPSQWHRQLSRHKTNMYSSFYTLHSAHCVPWSTTSWIGIWTRRISLFSTYSCIWSLYARVCYNSHICNGDIQFECTHRYADNIIFEIHSQCDKCTISLFPIAFV